MKKFIPFYWKKYRLQQTYKSLLTEFNNSLKLIGDLELLKDYITTKIRQVSKVKQVHIFLLNNELYRFFINGDPQLNRELYFTLNDRLIFWLRSNETYLNLVKQPDIKTFLTERENMVLDKLEAKFICPLRVMNKTKGMVVLTDKAYGQTFEQEEVYLLLTLIDQASFAIENALLYQMQADRLKKMYHADRMAIMGQLAAGAAHEIRNPLTSIRSTIQYLKRDIKDPGKSQMVSNLISEVDRINTIIQGLLTFSKPYMPKSEKIDINAIIHQTLQLISNNASKKNIRIEYFLNTQKNWIEADPAQLKQVFLNILINAIQAIGNDGEINISVEDSESSETIPHGIKEEVYIIITDNGTGIAQEDIDKIFDPFYTTKNDGTGLGLSISYGIINRHGGDIKVKSMAGESTTVIISLPILPV